MSRADTVLRYVSVADDDGVSRWKLDVHVAGGRVALVGGKSAAEATRAWFDAATETVRVLPPHTNGWYRLSPRIARSARSRLDRFRARIAERIEGHEVQDIEQALSLAERIEQREFGGSAAEKLSYEAVGESRRAQYRCEQFNVFQSHGEIRVHDRAVCMGVFRDILVDPDDIETLERFGRASRAIAESVALYAAAVPRFGVDLSEGLPISARYLGLDAPFELVLASVETDTIVSETLFDVPEEADREIDLKTSIMSPR